MSVTIGLRCVSTTRVSSFLSPAFEQAPQEPVDSLSTSALSNSLSHVPQPRQVQVFAVHATDAQGSSKTKTHECEVPQQALQHPPSDFLPRKQPSNGLPPLPETFLSGVSFFSSRRASCHRSKTCSLMSLRTPRLSTHT